MTNAIPTGVPEGPRVELALIIDGSIASLLNADEAMAAILLSNPTILEITVDNYAENGLYYNSDSGTFSMQPLDGPDLNDLATHNPPKS
jgi:hypothetical protein